MGYEWVFVAAAGILAATGLYGSARCLRARAGRRWLGALNAFADREIAEHRRWRGSN
jgi:hypothetical protein